MNNELSPEAAKLKERLEAMVWDAADSIGNSWMGRNYSDEKTAGYAEGVKNTVDGLAERTEFIVDTKQISGALGERLRRTNSPGQKLVWRALNSLLERIRDKRIAMLDKYESLDYPHEMRPWEKKLRELTHVYGRAEVETPGRWEELAMVQRELQALWSLHSHLWLDRSWVDNRLKRQRETAPVVAEVAA